MSGFVIPAEAGIQAGAGCRIKSGMTALAYLDAGLIKPNTDHFFLAKHPNTQTPNTKHQTLVTLKEDEMTERLQVYKCGVCGNIVEVMHAGGGELVCCGQAMALVKENTVDASKEKHVPVVERTADGFKVKVGSVAHPMEDKHWIEWVEVIADGKVHRQYLKPGQAPEAVFCVKADTVTAREYCNLHGLWKA
jgi:superoxide reductase